MRLKFAQYLVALTLVTTIGGHWALLQSVAWLGMIMNYAQDSTLAVALEKTFDGQHPCELCKVVQEGKQADKKRDLLKVEIKLELWTAPLSAQLIGPAPLRLPSELSSFGLTRSESPAIPPPRLA